MVTRGTRACAMWWTLGTWEAKCHALVMHEISGGDWQNMKNTWHRITMCQGGFGGVLYTQTKTVHGRKERKQKKKGKGKVERKEKKEKEKMRGVQFLLVFQHSSEESPCPEWGWSALQGRVLLLL